MNAQVVKAIIFDLDGVIVSTDDCHYLAWKEMADSEKILFDRNDNERLRGVSRMESLSIILEKAEKTYTDAQKEALADQKNELYKVFVQKLTPRDILPGALETLRKLKADGIRIAIGSSSKNAPEILARIGLSDFFDAVADGNHIKNSKPDPEVFLLAAKKLGVAPEFCLVVEDADAGIDAAINAGMRTLGIGSAAAHIGASLTAADLQAIDLAKIIKNKEV